ncbi:2-succinyl-5-enolpyruvyl-6-hydroxy-3-cyclohexene-1-carboxylic-acid synthase [Nesterenkonia lutea]|uniref:2-succinyl-5-enolpyruvyl-6-hydroxy-3-cyclohexene-1-carboxylate synthase n=1 Tax=Nesterenkonia lutea TaxID=272919 RepID=A0ABR9JAN5_9MICC|nr:2-succinyl-5-enolpyruvyl-6-hydroxy-3-cyclohexene-1-carboxylic-acid synthase [Nesterenkonia lutea]MBE1522989.1 2-succinyl-5-enolpyruvyl-6-hydroxy-3-cyclohexene-1-carboxylate synthase [Nesterenkonia lutea]
MTSPRRPFREFDDAYDVESLRLARRVIRGLTMSMRHIVLAPGSRSAPMAYALREAEELGAITVHVRIDERSAAFTALGIAMATKAPAGVVTTSGTAAGNLLPAMMEADLSGVPLVAITADRPEELHGTGANQTAWQQGMFAGRVRDEIHLEQGEARLEPESRDDMLAAETQVGLLLRAATGSSPGPVHLNIGFRDPLVPAQREGTHQSGAQRWARTPFVRRTPVVADSAEQLRAQIIGGEILDAQDPAEVSDAEVTSARRGAGPGSGASKGTSGTDPAVDLAQRRTVFVMGADAPAEARELARRLGQPLLAEPTSDARWSDLGAVQGYRLILQAPAGSPASELAGSIERVVVAGRPTLTRPVQQLISRDDVEAVQYAPGGEAWFDHRLARRRLDDLTATALFAGLAPQGWHEAWTERGLAAQRLIDAALTEQETLAQGEISSVRVAQFVAETVKTPLLLGSSSVIRDVDLAAVLNRSVLGEEVAAKPGPGAQGGRRVYAMRGLAGIDGNLSAASGIALARNTRVTALVGDLTFLHDVNALLVPATEREPDLDIVVVNDSGGAIFDQLEHGAVGRREGQAETVERFFGTPQTVDIEALADAYGHEYHFADDLETLGEGLSGLEDRIGIRIIEVRTDRTVLRDFHARLLAAAADL